MMKLKKYTRLSIKMPDTKLLERLAEVEHRQWWAWSKTVAEKERNLSKERLKRWEGLWKPYNLLTDAQKKSDRAWAREILSIINDILKEEEMEIERYKRVETDDWGKGFIHGLEVSLDWMKEKFKDVKNAKRNREAGIRDCP